MAKVICLGHSALDRVFMVDAWPQASAKVRAHAFAEIGGGMAANAAVAAARLGGEVQFWGPAGDDSVAEVMRAQLQAAGVDVRGLRRCAGLSSSTSAILIDACGERLIVSFRGTALEAPADWLPLNEVGSADALLADVRWPQGAIAALRAARRARIPTVLDGDTAERAILEALAGEAEYVVFSEHELASLAGAGNIEGGLRRALVLGARFAAVTRGGGGVSWVESGESAGVRHLPAFSVPVVDTLAAGDVFHGAFALELVRGQASADALRRRGRGNQMHPAGRPQRQSVTGRSGGIVARGVKTGVGGRGLRRRHRHPARVGLGIRVFHVARGRARDRLAAMARHQPQRHVDAGGDARRGEYLAMLDHLRLRIDRNAGKQVLHQTERTPMRRGAQAVEQAGIAEDQRSGAYGRQGPDLGGALFDKREHGLVFHFGARAPAARHDQNVQRRTVVEGGVRQDLHAAAGGHRCGRLRDQQYLERRRLVAAARFIQARYREHLEGTAEIQHLDVVENDDTGALALHRSS
jgi:sulfofructose kinase